jgi:hypothetical protein
MLTVCDRVETQRCGRAALPPNRVIVFWARDGRRIFRYLEFEIWNSFSVAADGRAVMVFEQRRGIDARFRPLP